MKGSTSKLLKREIIILLCIVLVSIILYYIFSCCTYKVFLPDFFLTWHLFLEFSSIVMSFSVFAITYYTYEESNRLRSIIIACTFLAVSLLDLFHTFSYKGMPVFLTEASPDKATAFWTLARLTMSIGLFIATLIPCEKKVKRSQQGLWAVMTIIYSVYWLLSVSYHIDLFPPLFIEGQGLTPLKIYLEYSVVFIQVITAALFFVAFIKGDCEDIGHIHVVRALVFSIFSEIAFTRYNNVYDTYNYLGHLYKIVAYYILFRALFVQNVQKPYQDLRTAERKLSVYVDNLEQLVAIRTDEITQANRSLMRNLDYAKNILLALLPASFPVIKGTEFAAKYMPCEKVGGDFYNVFRLDEQNVGILIGDVAGHGVSAAMINVFINQNIFFKKEYDDGRQQIFTPRGVLMNCYHKYNEMPFPEEVYVVMLYGKYNVITGEFTYASAGMNTSPLILKADGRVAVLETDGFPICKFGSHYKPSYQSRTAHLSPGDALILYTDGLIEIDPRKPDRFSQEQLVQFITGLKDITAQEICDEISDAYHALREDQEMTDDVTILVVKAGNANV
jgi:sigma-B regulation protein RsbU (phosphoserine phosphatase)